MAPPKQKGQKMGLGEFLTDTSLGSWADEMEDAPMPSSRYGSSYSQDRSYGGGSMSSYQDRGYAVRDPLPLPSKPPYTVHLGNMSFDATDGDIHDLFAECEVTSVRIVEDKIDRKPKGFGYAEFATVEGLKKALDFNGTQFQGRNIRVSVAEPQKDRSEAREISDWTRKGPLPDLPGQRRDSRPGGFASGPPRSFDDTSADRPGRRQFEQGDGKVRDFSNWERKGPPQPVMPAAPPAGRPPSHDGPRERRNSPAWGEGRSQDGSRPPRRDFSDRPPPPERAPTAAEQDNQWRAGMRPDPPAAPQVTSPNPATRDPNIPPSPAASHAPLASRPKLNLQKRSVSAAAEPSPTTATTPGDARSSPFGAARPIDTSAREKEIEEKLRIKKEQEDKMREEKRVADEKAKEDRRLAKDSERIEKPRGKANGPARDAEAGEAPGSNIQILHRTEDQSGEGLGDREHSTTDDTGDATGKDLATSSAQDSKKPNGTEAEAAASNAGEDDGWNTVTKPQKNRKGGR